MMTVMTNDTTVAERISRSATIQLNGEMKTVFPLFGPVREMEWAAGWNPEIVYSENKEAEERMIFKTKPRFEGEPDYTWIITQYFPEQYIIEYTVSNDERIWYIRVQCNPAGNKTAATVTYTLTGLTERAVERNKQALEKMNANNLNDWQEAINHYLTTGNLLTTK